MRTVFGANKWVVRGTVVGFLVWAIILPFFHDSGSGFIEDMTLALAYTVMALGLNIIVGFAGLLDLGYVAFYALGALTSGWFMSGFFVNAGGGEGWSFLVGEPASNLPGVHLNFLLVLVIAVGVTTIAGMLIGLPTLRLRGDYIAIVTLAFGEIVGRIVINGDEITIAGEKLTNGRQGITPIDKINLPFVEPFTGLELRPWYFVALGLVVLVLFVNYRLRDSRLGRAWVALREDEVAAASMGVPLVKTKLMAYGTGAAFGGMSGVFLGSYLNTVNADQFQFSFSIFVLAMVILGGLGSIEGVMLGADSAVVHQLQPDSRRLQRLPAEARPRLRPDRAVVRHLRLPARDHDGAQARGPDPRAKTAARAPRGHRRRRFRARHERDGLRGQGLVNDAAPGTGTAPICSPPSTSRRCSAGWSQSRTSTSRSPNARSSRSSVRTGPARPPSSTC